MRNCIVKAIMGLCVSLLLCSVALAAPANKNKKGQLVEGTHGFLACSGEFCSLNFEDNTGKARQYNLKSTNVLNDSDEWQDSKYYDKKIKVRIEKIKGKDIVTEVIILN